jgi:hypothetical protein
MNADLSDRFCSSLWKSAIANQHSRCSFAYCFGQNRSHPRNVETLMTIKYQVIGSLMPATMMAFAVLAQYIGAFGMFYFWTRVVCYWMHRVKKMPPKGVLERLRESRAMFRGVWMFFAFFVFAIFLIRRLFIQDSWMWAFIIPAWIGGISLACDWAMELVIRKWSRYEN